MRTSVRILWFIVLLVIVLILAFAVSQQADAQDDPYQQYSGALPTVTVCRSADVDWPRYEFHGVTSQFYYVADGGSLSGDTLVLDATMEEPGVLVQVYNDLGEWAEYTGDLSTPLCTEPAEVYLTHYTAYDVECDPCSWYFADEYGTEYHVADTPRQEEDGRYFTRLDAVELHDYYVR